MQACLGESRSRFYSTITRKAASRSSPHRQPLYHLRFVFRRCTPRYDTVFFLCMGTGLWSQGKRNEDDVLRHVWSRASSNRTCINNNSCSPLYIYTPRALEQTQHSPAFNSKPTSHSHQRQRQRWPTQNPRSSTSNPRTPSSKTSKTKSSSSPAARPASASPPANSCSP